MADRIHRPVEYPYGVHATTADPKHLDVLINGFMRRNAVGPALSERDREKFAELLAEKDRRRALPKALPRRLEVAS